MATNHLVELDELADLLELRMAELLDELAAVPWPPRAATMTRPSCLRNGRACATPEDTVHIVQLSFRSARPDDSTAPAAASGARSCCPLYVACLLAWLGMHILRT